MFLMLTFAGMTTVLPLNYFANPDSFEGPAGFLNEIKILKQFTVENVPQQSHFLLGHLLFTWLISFIAYGFLITYYRNHVQMKLKFHEHLLKKSSLRKIELRSIMVYGIPEHLRNEISLGLYFENLNLGKVQNVVICRKWTKLRKAVAKRAYYLDKLEGIYAQTMENVKNSDRLSWLFDFSSSSEDSIDIPLFRDSSSVNDVSEDVSTVEIMTRLSNVDPKLRPRHRIGFGGLFGKSVDSATFFAEKFEYWTKKVHYLRRHYEQSLPSSIGFVTFESCRSAVNFFICSLIS
jgi:hypothetical protein